MTDYTTEQTLASLRNEIETHHSDDWGVVYLDNARLPGQSATQFRAHLAALAKRGDYKVYDGSAFGLVRRADVQGVA